MEEKLHRENKTIKTDRNSGRMYWKLIETPVEMGKFSAVEFLFHIFLWFSPTILDFTYSPHIFTLVSLEQQLNRKLNKVWKYKKFIKKLSNPVLFHYVCPHCVCTGILPYNLENRSYLAKRFSWAFSFGFVPAIRLEDFQYQKTFPRINNKDSGVNGLFFKFTSWILCRFEFLAKTINEIWVLELTKLWSTFNCLVVSSCKDRLSLVLAQRCQLSGFHPETQGLRPNLRAQGLGVIFSGFTKNPVFLNLKGISKFCKISIFTPQEIRNFLQRCKPATK
jgi:hypothetical protein